MELKGVSRIRMDKGVYHYGMNNVNGIGIRIHHQMSELPSGNARHRVV